MNYWNSKSAQKIGSFKPNFSFSKPCHHIGILKRKKIANFLYYIESLHILALPDDKRDSSISRASASHA